MLYRAYTVTLGHLLNLFSTFTLCIPILPPIPYSSQHSLCSQHSLYVPLPSPYPHFIPPSPQPWSSLEQTSSLPPWFSTFTIHLMSYPHFPTNDPLLSIYPPYPSPTLHPKPALTQPYPSPTPNPDSNPPLTLTQTLPWSTVLLSILGPPFNPRSSF